MTGSDDKKRVWRQRVVAKLRDRLREECLNKGKEMRAALLAARRTNLTGQSDASPHSSSQEPGSSSQPSSQPSGTSDLLQSVSAQVSKDVHAAVQSALHAALSQVALKDHSNSTSQPQEQQTDHPMCTPVRGEASSAAGQNPMVLHPPSASTQLQITPCQGPHHCSRHQYGTPESAQGQQQGGWRMTDPHAWLYDDQEFERELSAAMDADGSCEEGSREADHVIHLEEEYEALAAQLYSELYDEVLAVQLEEIRKQQEEQGSQGDGVVCPVCRVSQLVQLGGAIGCPREGWRLDMRCEGVTLDHLRSELDQVYQAHWETSRCQGPLQFSIDSLAPGIQGLVAKCGACGMWHVVV